MLESGGASGRRHFSYLRGGHPPVMTDEEAKKVGIVRLDDKQVAALPATAWLTKEDLLPDDGDPWNEEWSWEEEFLYSFCSELDDSVQMYLKEIGKVALLTPEDEISLTWAMSAGNKAKDRLTEFRRRQEERKEADPSEESTLKKQRRPGETARQKLVEANLRLVVHIAKDYVGRGMLFLDLIQEGNLGLLKAAEVFDYTKGYKLSTYAARWIHQAITRAVACQGWPISILASMDETINKVIRVSRLLLQELGHDPSSDEIAAEMNLPVARVWEYLKIAQEPVSLDALDAVSDVPKLRLNMKREIAVIFMTQRTRFPRRGKRGSGRMARAP